jgi:hypothetical protein
MNIVMRGREVTTNLFVFGSHTRRDWDAICKGGKQHWPASRFDLHLILPPPPLRRQLRSGLQVRCGGIVDLAGLWLTRRMFEFALWSVSLQRM